MIGQDHQLVLYHCGSLFHRQILVIAHDTVAHGNTRHQADHQRQQEDPRPQTSKRDHALQLFPYSCKTFFIPFFHSIKTSVPNLSTPFTKPHDKSCSPLLRSYFCSFAWRWLYSSHLQR